MVRIQTVTSAANPLVKELRAVSVRGGLTRDGFAIAEGFHLLEEAVRSGVEIGRVVVAEGAAKRLRDVPVEVTALPDKLFTTLTSTESSQGVMTLVRPPEADRERMFRAQALVVILDGIQDPGNAGTIVRSAEAFGATGVVFLKGTVSPWNPKTLRGAAGSLFRVPAETGLTAEEAVRLVGERGLRLFAAMPGGDNLEAADFGVPCAITIGSEGAGVCEEIRRAATSVSIPTTGVESLNAAVSASIILYAAAKKR